MRHQLLILARLATEDSLSPSELSTSLATLVDRAAKPPAITRVLAPHVDALVAAGQVARGTRGRLSITSAGRARTIQELGVDAVPAWKELRSHHLPALALGIKPAQVTPIRDVVIAHLLAQLTGVSTRTGDAREIIRSALGAAVREKSADGTTLPAQLARRWLSGEPTFNLKTAAPAAATVAESRAPVTTWGDSDVIAAVTAATPRVPAAGRFGSDLVFVSALWRQLHEGASFPGLTFEDLKRRLLDANRAKQLTLARADLVGAMDPREVAASEIRHQNATFHFVVDRSRL